MMNRRSFVRATPGLLAAALSAPVRGGEASGTPPIIGRSRRASVAGDGEGRLDVGDRKSLRILQFTDNHFFCGVEDLTVSEGDRATERDWQAFVRVFRPDLLVLSGDLWHDNPGGRGLRTLEMILPRLERLEIPWATCWGNHDQLDEYQAGHDAMESARNSRYRGGATHGDYRLEVRTREGVAAQLWFLNSNQFGLTEWQLAWLRKSRSALPESQGRPALAFFHIPLLDQKTLYRRNQTPGVCQEEVCFERESGRALPVLAESGAIRATFCGHDHVNDYAVRAREVDLVYGRATGYSGYGGEKLRKGAKLIELDLGTGGYVQRTVFADGTSWKPV